jgi:uncharacterized protein (DUF1330 family)
MVKAYWIVCYRSVSNPDAIAAYAKLAGSALTAHGARYLVRGVPERTYEAGLQQRSIVIEFDNLEAAIAAYESTEYQAALKVFNNAAERDIRIVEGGV